MIDLEETVQEKDVWGYSRSELQNCAKVQIDGDPETLQYFYGSIDLYVCKRFYLPVKMMIVCRNVQVR